VAGPFSVDAKGLTAAGRGWEMLAEANIVEQLPAMVAELEAKSVLPIKPVEPGRSLLVCDATTMAGLVDATLGRATEVDRVLGYEANASGTSYLGPDPLKTLGTSVASPLVNVTADRSLSTGLATVQWDVEGVTPDDFPLIREGVLVDFQTTREQASWLAPWYQRAGTPVRSHGCAAAEDALSLPMQMTPNLTLAPSPAGRGFEDLVSQLADGIVAEEVETSMDFQCRNGVLSAQYQGVFYQVKQGKRVARLKNADILFNSPEFWKNLIELGGAASVVHVPGSESKGSPEQSTMHTIRAVPAVIKNVAVIDRTRKV
jgi:TldD protein